MMKIGVQLYSVRDEMERDFEGTLKEVAAMGYEGRVSVEGKCEDFAPDAKAACDALRAARDK